MPGRDYQLLITRQAQKELADLPPKIGRQMAAAIDRIRNTLNAGQRPQDMRRLHGRPGSYRVDSGEYRILFELDDTEAIVRIFRVRHRREAYRNL